MCICLTKYMYTVCIHANCVQASVQCAGDNREWNSSVYRQLERWSGYFHDIVGGMTKGHPIHLVRYEDLKSDTYKEVKAMLDFLKFDYEEKDLRARIASNFSTFYRYIIIIILLLQGMSSLRSLIPFVPTCNINSCINNYCTPQLYVP